MRHLHCSKPCSQVFALLTLLSALMPSCSSHPPVLLTLFSSPLLPALPPWALVIHLALWVTRVTARRWMGALQVAALSELLPCPLQSNYRACMSSEHLTVQPPNSSAPLGYSFSSGWLNKSPVQGSVPSRGVCRWGQEKNTVSI